ncbi:MAG TPA: SGNH/GDSL hydrolase family protein [Burkholderiales bacterium]|nr:SGNH/GDSL hydrolase family protein [Burkholderiales bacterium]
MRRFVLPAITMVAAALLAVLAFEVLLRAIGWSNPIWYRPDAQLGWTLRPGVSGWYTKEGRGFVEVNADGRRDAAVPLAKPADVYRIAVLGDSYSEAMQVPMQQAFWALLPARLEACGYARGKKIETLNFGVSGYGTAQELVALETRALRYKPDLVLLQFTNGNDVQNNSAALEQERDRPFYRFGPDGMLRADDSFLTDPGFRSRASASSERVRQLTNHSRVLQLVRAVREMPLLPTANAKGRAPQGVEQGLEAFVLAPPKDERWEEAWRITEALIDKVAEAAERGGARFALFTVPYAIQVHPDRRTREALQTKLGVPDLLYPDRRLAALAGRHRIIGVALAPQMQKMAEKSGTYFHGFGGAGLGKGHWNAAGHAAAADLIARRLCEVRG